jgi:hypothetical protein
VTAIGTDGSLTLAPATHNRLAARIAGGASVRDVPGWYVATRVELAYTTTVYGAQGETTATGHMLVTETTTGSATYVGMTRGRDNNVAHLVADNVDEARAIWTGVMGRDRADLGPAHAAEQAAEEMERYAPQRPARVVLDQLHQAWTRQADLTGQAQDLTLHRDDIETVMSIRAEHEPRARALREAEQAAWDRAASATGALKALEARIATEQRDLTTTLLDHWHREHVGAYQAAAVLGAGAGRLGQHRRQVREARADLTDWAQRWQPILPGLPTEPDQIRHQLETPPAQMRGDQLRQTFADTARQTVARAHPEAEPMRTEATAARRAAVEAHDAATAFNTKVDKQLRPYRWAHARDGVLPEQRARIGRELDTVTASLDEVNARVQQLLHSPRSAACHPAASRPSTTNGAPTGPRRRKPREWLRQHEPPNSVRSKPNRPDVAASSNLPPTATAPARGRPWASEPR